MSTHHHTESDPWRFWQERDQRARSNLPNKRSQPCERNRHITGQPYQPTSTALYTDQLSLHQNAPATSTNSSTMTIDHTASQLPEGFKKQEKRLSTDSIKTLYKPNHNDLSVYLLPTEPVLVCTDDNDHRFDITNDAADVEEMSNRLACLAKVMLDKIDNLCKTTTFRFDRKFRLEFLPLSFYQGETGVSNNNHWELRINLDPVTWFDWKWSNTSSSYDAQKEVLVVARNYVEKYKNFISEEYLNAPKEAPLILDSKFAPSLVICNENVAGKKDRNGKCGLCIAKETVVMTCPISKGLNYNLPPTLNSESNSNGEASSFILTSKKEPVRDLLLHPTPPWHIVNSELVCLPAFWSVAIHTCRHLHKELQSQKRLTYVKWPVDAIAINFGQWESAGSKAKYALACHAHAHFLLTHDFINQCNDNFFCSLKGRQEAPPNYLYKNVKLLEDERLLNYEMQALQQDMRNCLNKIKDIEANGAQQNDKIDKILERLERYTKTQDDKQDVSNRTSLSNRYLYSHTNYSSYSDLYSTTRYSYFFHTRESP